MKKQKKLRLDQQLPILCLSPRYADWTAEMVYSNNSNMCQLVMLTTNIPDHVRQTGSEEAVSVIHAPESFHSWVSRNWGMLDDQ